MSELSSLYVKLKIKKDNLERFFQDKPMAAEVDQDWASWWESREMYSPSPLTEIPACSSATNRDMLESLIKDPQTAGHEQEEEGQGIWSFSVVFFCENYYESLPILAWLKGIAHYMEAGDEGVALIYDFFWGSESVMAHLVFREQKALLAHTKSTSQIEQSIRDAAKNTLQTAVDLISAKYGG
ncbi:hypothetical protein [Chitinophaga sp. S165]|uniref:hypothetical protein n=1 Tax=Chitinophaga sp. S165 TaxID=2135462 RepID=UPI000D71270D|nr:hypothetical protein [Chitinophaga sp. S165]PWV48320.1 hypothetical protein C7475_107228 [Chitinophaga sp. S165]